MLNPLQSKLLEMLDWLTNFIHKQGLRYYVVGGTLLGAIRHQGFIPWDDDIDIAMPRCDYVKLVDLLREPVEHYVIEAPDSKASDYVYAFAKFYDINTSMTEYLRHSVHRGVYIDVFPLDGVGNTLGESKNYYRKIDRINMLLAMKVAAYRDGRKWWKNMGVFFGNFIPISGKNLAKRVDEVCSERTYDECKYVANCMGSYRSREILKKTIFGEAMPYNFENIIVYGPEQAEEYLETIYGNWRELPPETKRHSAHDFIDLDLNTPYKNVNS